MYGNLSVCVGFVIDRIKQDGPFVMDLDFEGMNNYIGV